MKKILFAFTILFITMISAHAQQPRISIEVIMGSRPPAPSELQLMQAEENKHPNIAKAMHDMENALKRLHDAPDDFGGHKGQAETDLKQALISLRKALYFRLYQDTH
jgi:hypothetical protein